MSDGKFQLVTDMGYVGLDHTNAKALYDRLGAWLGLNSASAPIVSIKPKITKPMISAGVEATGFFVPNNSRRFTEGEIAKLVERVYLAMRALE